MKRLGTLLVAAALVAACGSSKGNGGSSGNGGGAASGGNSGNGGSSASGGSGTGGSSASGGSGTGGSGTGGTGTGGSGTGGGTGGSGGFSGGAGTPGIGGSGGTMATPACTQASDCTLHSDCCNCVALAPGDQAPACNTKNCTVDACAKLGITSKNVACTAGACNAGIDCDPSTVTCQTAQPNCPAGQVPSVRGLCWGPCVLATACSNVADCTACDSNSVCVDLDSKPLTTHCVPVAPICSSKHDCACLANAVCLSPYDLCVHTNGTNQILCTCTSC